MTNAEKRESVIAALKADPARADRDIARRLGVSHTYVSGLRAGLNGNVASRKAKSDTGLNGNVASVASEDSNQDLFLSLGLKLVDDDAQWVREACEVLLATLPARPDKLRKSDAGINKGVFYGHEAINCLKRIPKNANPEWSATAFRIVTDWIKQCEMEIARKGSAK